MSLMTLKRTQKTDEIFAAIQFMANIFHTLGIQVHNNSEWHNCFWICQLRNMGCSCSSYIILNPHTRLYVGVSNKSTNKCNSGFGGLEVACWPLVPKFAGSHPAEAVRYLGRKKILSTPSFGGEVKPSVSCRSFTACKRSLSVTWKSAF